MKKIVLLLVSALLLACTCSVPAGLVSGTPRPTVAAQPSDQSVPHGNITLVRLYPAGGNLISQLEAESPKTSALGQHMFVEFDASW